MDDFQKDVLDRLARIEERQKMPGPSCAVHTEQIGVLTKRVEVVETAQAKQNLIAVTLGAIGAAIAMMVKFAVTGSAK